MSCGVTVGLLDKLASRWKPQSIMQTDPISLPRSTCLLATFYLLSAGSSFIWVAKKQVSSRQLRAKLLVRCNVMAGSKFAYVADLLLDTCQRIPP